MRNRHTLQWTLGQRYFCPAALEEHLLSFADTLHRIMSRSKFFPSVQTTTRQNSEQTVAQGKRLTLGQYLSPLDLLLGRSGPNEVHYFRSECTKDIRPSEENLSVSISSGPFINVKPNWFVCSEINIVVDTWCSIKTTAVVLHHVLQH